MPIERTDILTLLKHSHLFRGVDDQKLSAAVDHFEIVEVPSGEVIYQQGDDSEWFYFLCIGRLKVSRIALDTRQLYPLGYLEEGDYFGHEVLAENWSRQVMVETVTEATLLRLTVPNFQALLEDIPALSPRLQLILDSYRLMLKTRFSWVEPEEYIYYVARRHILFLFTRIFPPLAFGLFTVPVFLFLALNSALATTNLLLLIFFSVISLGWTVWNWVDWTNDYYIVTTRRILYQERVIFLYDSRLESPLEALQSTSINTTQIGRILGYGNLAIRTYIGTILFGNINDPEQVMGIVQQQQARSQISQQRIELSQIDALLEKRIVHGPPSPVKVSQPPAAPPQISPTQRFLSDMFHLRYEISGTVLYRTHWFILLQKIWAPSLLLMGLLGLWLMSFFGRFTLLSLGSITALVLLIGLVVGCWWLYQYMDWHNDIYLVTKDQIVDVNKKPLGKEERKAAPLKNILSIEYKRLGILGLLLNFGTVSIRVGDQTLTFDDVFNPSEVQRELFDRLAARTYADRQAAQEEERQRIGNWIAAYHKFTQRNQPPRTRGGF